MAATAQLISVACHGTVTCWPLAPRSIPMLHLQIIVLILSQDTSFSHNIHKVYLPGAVSWYKERVLNKISLGSLVYVVLLR